MCPALGYQSPNSRNISKPVRDASSAAVSLSERQSLILDIARRDGEVEVEALADQLQVTPQTIRRDLNGLCRHRKLQRIHGGAVLYDGVNNLDYESRRRFMQAEKTAIGVSSACLIPNDSTLFVNIGTTTEAVVRQLIDHQGLLVVTNNANVIEILRHNHSTTIMLAGGKLRNEDGGITGEATADFIHKFYLEHSVIGVSALHADGTLLDYDQQEVNVAQAIIRNSRTDILVADSSKFERSAPMRIGTVEDIDIIVTDAAPPAEFIQRCEQTKTRIVIAEPVSAAAGRSN